MNNKQTLENAGEWFPNMVEQLKDPDTMIQVLEQTKDMHTVMSDDTVVMVYQKRNGSNRTQAIASAHDLLAIEYESIATDADRKLRSSDEYLNIDLSNLLPAAIKALQNHDTMNMFMDNSCGVISLRVPETHVLVLPTDQDESFAKSTFEASCLAMQAYDGYVEEYPDEAISMGDPE